MWDKLMDGIVITAKDTPLKAKLFCLEDLVAKDTFHTPPYVAIWQDSYPHARHINVATENDGPFCSRVVECETALLKRYVIAQVCI
jgi:hypothetical protein